MGFVLPGETAAILGGVVAHRGNASLPVMITVVVVAAIAGDSVGYEVGKHAGPRLLESRPLRRHAHRLDDARSLLKRRGGMAVFMGRWVAFFRAVMPALAGLSRMYYPKFLAYNAAGGLVWGVAVVLLGYFASNTYEHIVKTFGRGAAALALAVVLGLFVVHKVRESRREREEEAEYEREHPVGPGV